ncbi:MAG TPA: cytochrome c peroxidase [Polyangia bacterium]|jgi:cytochrome c peroxidase|nr:cytochrome c peroxidase [Polyangia bacterium]
MPGLAAAAMLTAFAGCGAEPAAPASGEAPDLTADARALMASPISRVSGRAPSGKQLFERAFPHTNGRSCATCHVLDEATTLRPASVEARFRADPADPLFSRLDADDPAAATPTFAHLAKGLVRVVLPLPDNMDVIDFDGQVVTPADRTIAVWRGVPSVANTAYTAPYQLDGRAASLPEQAQGAITAHSQGPNVSRRDLDRIAFFEGGEFSSGRAAFVGAMIELGVPPADIPVPEKHVSFTAPQRRGRAVYDAACAACHGGATTSKIVNPEVQAFFFPALDADGNVKFDVVPGQGPVPQHVARPGVEIVNVGYGITTYFGQIGVAPAFNSSVELPRYRFRFYQDGTRQQRVVDLPPVPRTVSGNPLDPRPALDDRGAPIVGPNLIPQLFTTDPGRAAITGDPADFEAFDVPQLRGIALTAPYFHDNSHETLRDVVDTYSRFVLPAIPAMALPAVNPPEHPGTPPESLSPAQKDDLLAFLQVL